MAAILQRWDAVRASGLVGQLVRFGVAGAFSALVYSAIYLPLASFALPRHLAWMAVPPAFVVAVVTSFVLHSKWSFKDHGTRDTSGRQHLKFLAVQSFGMVLNAGYAWVISDLFHQPSWVPLIPAVTVTPIITFIINRQWVFGD